MCTPTLRNISMPNKRKKGLESVTGWVEESLKAELQKIADDRKIPLARLVVTILKEQAAIYGKKRTDNSKS